MCGTRFDEVLSHISGVLPSLVVPFTSELSATITSNFYNALKKHDTFNGTCIQKCLFDMIPNLSRRSEKYVNFILITDACDTISDVCGLKKCWAEARNSHRLRTGGVLTGKCTFIGAGSGGCTKELKEVFPTAVVSETELAAHLKKTQEMQAKTSSALSDISRIDTKLAKAGTAQRITSTEIKMMITEVETVASSAKTMKTEINQLVKEGNAIGDKVKEAKLKAAAVIDTKDLKVARKLRRGMRKDRMDLTVQCSAVLSKLKLKEVETQKLEGEQMTAKKKTEQQMVKVKANIQTSNRLDIERKAMFKDLDKLLEGLSEDSKEDEDMVKSMLDDAEELVDRLVGLNAQNDLDLGGIQKVQNSLMEAEELLEDGRQSARQTHDQVMGHLKQLAEASVSCSQRSAGK